MALMYVGSDKEVFVKRQLVGLIGFGLISCTSYAQSSAIYEFDLSLTENQLIDNGISSRFDNLTIGTSGFLRMEVAFAPIVIPGFKSDNASNYSVLNVNFSTVGVDTQGAPGQYPSTQIFTTVSVADNTLVNAPADRYSDQMGVIYSLTDSDLLVPVLFVSESAIGSDPELWSDTDLPTSTEILAASQK